MQQQPRPAKIEAISAPQQLVSRRPGALDGHHAPFSLPRKPKLLVTGPAPAGATQTRVGIANRPCPTAQNGLIMGSRASANDSRLAQVRQRRGGHASNARSNLALRVESAACANPKMHSP
jgi:hypothetical protein